MSRFVRAAVLAFVFASPTGAAAAAPVPFRSVLPPGQSGFADAPQLAQFLSTGRRPPHSDDQLRMYARLVRAAPHITAARIGRFYKDATFGVKPGEAQRTYRPRADVTIVRGPFGVPHVYGSTRAGTMFGIGYATAEDRLFFVDVLRHLGRARLSSFVGGSPANRAMDREQWAVAPYTEADLRRQIRYARTRLGAIGRRLDADSRDYVAGINAYLARARLNPLMMPAEYAATGRPRGPGDFRQSDVVAIASLVGGIFGKGGGKELPWAQLLQGFQRRLGRAAGRRAWLDFRDPEDPEAPTTVHDGRRFPYRTPPRRVAAGSVAMPDPGSVRDVQHADSGGGGRTLPPGNSNALVVSGAHTASGHPIAVFGPQVGYFSPQLLVEQDVHGPGIDAEGAAFPGVNLYVQLGHGRDYAWSATSAGQDIIDTFALPLCRDATHYRFRGRCRPMERLQRTNRWTPNLGDPTPPGSETLTAYRTAMGLVTARARIHGRPVVYTQLRSTYFHEIDSAAGFAAFNDPRTVRGPRAFQRAASLVGYTFNWFYVDARHTAYFNSGANPVRAPRLDPRLPAWGAFAWRHWDPDDHTAELTPFSQHPRVIDQDYLTSWNNKQAPGYQAPDTSTPYTSLFRNLPLDDRIRAVIRGGGRMTRARLVNAMGDAGTVDMRGAYVLPWLLRVLDARPTPAFTAASRPRVRRAVGELRAWLADGAHRRDRDGDGTYEHSDATRIMDAWWPRLVRAEFGPTLGRRLLADLEATDPIDNTPNNGGAHLGSAWDVGFYGTVQKDLRSLLERPVRGTLRRVYCGRGNLGRCRRAVARTLARAAAVPASRLYEDATCRRAGRDGDQACFDAIAFRALGAITQPLIPWINRPTFQQVVEIPRGR